jgi:hypothetical protein
VGVCSLGAWCSKEQYAWFHSRNCIGRKPALVVQLLGPGIVSGYQVDFCWKAEFHVYTDTSICSDVFMFRLTFEMKLAESIANSTERIVTPEMKRNIGESYPNRSYGESIGCRIKRWSQSRPS